MSFQLFLASSTNTPWQSISKEMALLNNTTAPLRSSSESSWMASNKPRVRTFQCYFILIAMCCCQDNDLPTTSLCLGGSPMVLVWWTHLSDNLWVRQLQETQHELAKEAHGVDNAQKEKTEIWHGKPEEEFKVGNLVLIHSIAASIDELQKLRHWWKGGPYKIIKICSLQTIKVRNTAGPETDKVVNLNCIKKFILCDDEDRELADDEYKVEKILNHRYTSQGLEYRLK